MKIITAINEEYSVVVQQSLKIFLAGGISNCPNWQADAISYFSKVSEFDFTVYNPRRDSFPIDDPKATEQQTVWEYNHLRESDIILYWFSKGSLNPIVLYELGMWGNSSDKMIFVGIDPGYERAQDVIIQTALARPELHIYNNLEDMISSITHTIISSHECCD